MLPRPFVPLVACAALSCSTFHTVDPNTDASPAVDAGTGADTGARDATADATRSAYDPDYVLTC